MQLTPWPLSIPPARHLDQRRAIACVVRRVSPRLERARILLGHLHLESPRSRRTSLPVLFNLLPSSSNGAQISSVWKGFWTRGALSLGGSPLSVHYATEFCGERRVASAFILSYTGGTLQDRTFLRTAPFLSSSNFS